MSLSGKTNEEKIWNYLKSKGLNDFGAAGVMGNLKAESGLNPQNLQNNYEKKLGLTDMSYTQAVDKNVYDNFVKDSAGYGLAQWTYWSRKQNLLNFAKKQKKSIGDLEMQLDFLWLELEGYKSIIPALKKATTVLEASNVILLEYEKPADQSKSVQTKRASYGQEYYDKFAKITGGTKMKVAIDAGHGSNTSGKRTPDGYREHWINVSCANYCEAALKRSGIEVVKVAWDDNNAKDDADVALGTRQSQIKSAKCDISVSFHANAFGNGTVFNSANGVETLIHNVASAVGDSKKLANCIHNQLIKGTPQTNRGVKSQNLALCDCRYLGTKAAVLVEIGFMTNKAEADLMKTDKFCKEQAEEVARGICEYFGVSYKESSNSSSNSGASSSVKVNKTPGALGLVKVIYKGSEGVSLREKPSADSEVKQVITGGTYTVVEISDDNQWYKLKSGLYITSNPKFVRFTPDKLYDVVITADALRVRTGAGLNHSVITNVKKGETYSIVEEKNGWGRIKSDNNLACWISLEWTEKV